MKLEEFIEFAERYKNWGRWGADDEAGTLNFVTPQHVADACRLVREGAHLPARDTLRRARSAAAQA